MNGALRDRKIDRVRRRDGEVVAYCECGGTMEPETARDLEAEVVYLLWRCLVNRNHVTRAIPLTAQLADAAER